MNMKSEYHHRFWLRVAEASRAGWACLLVSVILLYVPNSRNLASVPVLAPVLAVLLAGPPLGTVLQNSWGILTVAVPAISSTIAVLYVLKPPISIVEAIACIGVSSCLIAYLSETHILGRKISLAQVSIVYISAHYTPDMNRVTFPLKMLPANCVGIVMAIIATLIPFPRLAIREVRGSAKSSARGLSELLKALVNTILAPDDSSFGSMHLHSKLLAKASSETLADLKKKQVDIWWEMGACGARRKMKQFTKGVDCLHLHLAGMEMALESGYVLSTPAPLRGILQGALLKVVEQCNSLLDCGVKGLRPCTASMDGRSRQKVIEEGKEVLSLFDTSYRAAREQAYYTLSKASSFDERETDLEPWREYRLSSTLPDLNFIKRRFRGRVSMLFFMFNLRLYLMEAINLVSASHRSANKMHRLAMIGPCVTSLEQAMQAQTNQTKLDSKISETSPPNSRNFAGPVFVPPHDPSMTASRRLSSARVSDLVSRQGSRTSSEERSGRVSASVFLRPDDPSMIGSRRISLERFTSNPGSRQSSRRVSNSSEIRMPQSSVPEGDDESRESSRTDTGLSSGDEKRGSMHRQCSHRNAGNMETIIKAAGGGTEGRTRKFLRRLGLKPSKTQTKRSFKTALEMVLATVFGNLVLQGKSQVFWAPVTVGFIIGNFQGGSWRISNLRLQGTVLGSIYGFLALSASNNHRWAILLLLIPWVIFSSFIRYSPAYGYSGLVAAFTAAILMLGGYQSDIKSFALDRITETFVGILCFVFVETFIFPERAVVLVRKELVSSLVSLRDCVGAIVSVYTDQELQECLHCRSLAVIEIKHLEQRLRASFAKQSVLSKEAALEPDLWFVPFAADVYSKIIAIQGRMLDLLFFMVCSLHATTEDCVSEQMETLLKPLRTSLTALQEEVLASIDFLQEVLHVKPAQESSKLHRLKRWIGFGQRHHGSRNSGSTGDVEQQQQQSPQPASPNHHPHHPLLVLGRRNRSLDGIPTNLKTIMDSFEHSFEEVFEDLIATTKADGAKQMLGNTVMLSIGSLTFSLHALLRETVHLEKAIHELLQAESPWSVLDFWDKYAAGVFNPSLGRGQ